MPDFKIHSPYQNGRRSAGGGSQTGGGHHIASSDTYIEKDSAINDEIDRLRHSATSALSERRDVIIVSSVSCIYSLGDPIDYKRMVISIRPGMEISREQIIHRLIDIQYERNDIAFERNRLPRTRRHGGNLAGILG